MTGARKSAASKIGAGNRSDFIREYLVDLNATQAAIRAGYSPKTAHSQGQRLLKHVEVAQAIKAEMRAREKRTRITADRVLAEYAKLAFYDPRKFFDGRGRLIPIVDLDDESAAAVAGMDVVESKREGDEPEVIKKIKLADKKAALDSIARHLGMFVDRTELSGPKGRPIHAVADLPDSAKRALEELSRRAEAAGNAPSVQGGPVLPAEVRDGQG